MMDVSGGLAEDLSDFIPNTCTESPQYGKAFCSDHCKSVEKLGYPTGLREFIKSCGQDIMPENFNKDMQSKVNQRIKDIAKRLEVPFRSQSSTDTQGLIFFKFNILIF